MDIRALAEQYAPYIIERRRYYHQHPELSFKEFETANTKITQLNEELEKAEKRLTEYSEYSDEITDDNAEDYYE